MGLIKKISESFELKKEERLILREIAQERLNKKRALAVKQKQLYNMLDICFPCENIISLINKDGQVEYFLMDTTPFTAILLLQEGVPPIIKFKQLTGKNAGKIYVENKYATLIYGAVEAMNKGYSVGLFDLNVNDRSNLSVSINGYSNNSIEHHFAEDTELEKTYGKTISFGQLLMLWKSDNRQFMNINLESDYEMVKRVYNSEDILQKSKSEELSK